MAALDGSRGATVLLPEGDIFASITIDNGGGPGTTIDNLTLAGRGKFATRLHAPVEEFVDEEDQAFFAQKNLPVITTNPSRNTVRLVLRDFGIEGSVPDINGITVTRPFGSANMHGLHMKLHRGYQLSEVTYERLNVVDCAGVGLLLDIDLSQGSGGAHMQHHVASEVNIERCFGGGLYLDGAGIMESAFRDCYISHCGRQGDNDPESHVGSRPAIRLIPNGAPFGPTGITFENLTTNMAQITDGYDGTPVMHSDSTHALVLSGCDFEQGSPMLRLSGPTTGLVVSGCKFQQDPESPTSPACPRAIDIESCEAPTFTGCVFNGNIEDGIGSDSQVANARRVEVHNLAFNGTGKAVNLSSWTQIDNQKRIRSYAKNMALAPFEDINFDPPTFLFNLETISHYYPEGGTPDNDQISDGFTVTLRPYDAGHTFTIVHGTGNIRTRSGANLTITGHQTITLRWYAELALWLEV
jgi:hypothetical protein